MASTFKASYSGIGEMINSDFMVAEMRQRAERIRAAAEAHAPVGGEGDPHPGAYKESLTVDSGTHGGEHNDRAYGRVTANVPYAYQVEFGDKYTPRHRTLGTALDAAGD
jgi:hypothetical protein